MIKKVCIECDQRIKGRIDKRFCSDVCRSQYNNRISSKEAVFVRKVNSILARNRKVLRSFYQKQIKQVHLLQLESEGFNTRFFTNEYLSEDQKTYRFCYDFGLYIIRKDVYQIIEESDILEACSPQGTTLAVQI